MNTYQTALAEFGRQQPALFRALYPRAYKDTADWHSPKVAAVMLGSAVGLACMTPWESLPPSTRQCYFAAARCAEHAMPTYFISRQLLEAVARTNPPDDLSWLDLPMPHPGFTLILPRGALRHPTEGDVGAIVLARIPALEPITFPAVGAPTRRLDNDLLVACACTHESEVMPTYDCTLNASTHSRIGDLADVTAGTNTRATGAAEPMVLHDTQTAQSILSLAIRIALLMSARPELIEPGGLTGTQKKARTSDPLEFWTPTIVGRTYRTKIESYLPPVGTHAGPRLHWRRGHYASQPHGPRMSLRRIIWREPFLVGKI